MRPPKVFLLSMIFLIAVTYAHAQYAWEQKASFPASGRHRAASMAIGNRGYLGFGHYNSTGEVVFNDWWEYDPGSDSWTQKSSLPSSPRFGPVAFSIGNYGYIINGNDGNSNLSDSWKYNPTTNTWSAISPFPGSATGKAVGDVVNGKAYVGNAEATNAWYAYDPVLNSWSPCASFPGPQRNFSAVFSLNNKIYLGTGITFNYTTMYNDFWCYDPSVNTWTAKANFPGTPRYCCQGFAVNGRGYVGLGYSTATTNNFDEFYTYNDATNSWTQSPNFIGTARRLTTAFVLNNRAYLGTGTNGTNLNDFWEFNPMVGVEESSVNEIRVYPNPATKYFVIDPGKSISEGTLRVYDATGQVLHESAVSGNQICVQCESWLAGIYTVEIITNRNTGYCTKIVVN